MRAAGAEVGARGQGGGACSPSISRLAIPFLHYSASIRLVWSSRLSSLCFTFCWSIEQGSILIAHPRSSLEEEYGLSRCKALRSVPGISFSAFLIRLTQLTLRFPHGFFAQPPRQAVLFSLYYLLWHCGRQGCSSAVCGWLPYLCP